MSIPGCLSCILFNDQMTSSWSRPSAWSVAIAWSCDIAKDPSTMPG